MGQSTADDGRLSSTIKRPFGTPTRIPLPWLSLVAVGSCDATEATMRMAGELGNLGLIVEIKVLKSGSYCFEHQQDVPGNVTQVERGYIQLLLSL